MACVFGNTGTSTGGSGQGDSSAEDMDFDNGSQEPVTTGRPIKRHEDPNAPHMNQHDQTYSGDPGRHTGYDKLSTHKQAYRSKQASKQMVYEVYGNVISILEEFEKREMSKSVSPGKSVPKSDIYIPDQSLKLDEDVQGILETQLLLFETQLHKACRPEVRDEVLEEMKKTTLTWMAARKDENIQRGQTDEYAAQLYEILSRGGTKHPSILTEKPNIDEKELQTAVQQIFAGDQKRAELDESFHKDPNKKATMPHIRSGSVESGTERLEEVQPGLVEHEDSLR